MDSVTDSINKKIENFMNGPADSNDGYWKLFEVKSQVNDSIVEAVKYGYRKGYEQALIDVKAQLGIEPVKFQQRPLMHTGRRCSSCQTEITSDGVTESCTCSSGPVWIKK